MEVFNELAFELICEFCKNDINCIFKRLLSIEVHKSRIPTLGFWVWDIPNNVELYSPLFRETLGYTEAEFPNVPESWQKTILKKDLEIAFSNYESHIKTKGQAPYLQTVSYRKKGGSILNVVCHGKVVSWQKDMPKIMIGVHAKPKSK